MAANPQGDAAGEERQGVVALEDVHGPIGVRGARMACAAKVPACVQPTTVTVLVAKVSCDSLLVKRLSIRNDIRKKAISKGEPANGATGEGRRVGPGLAYAKISGEDHAEPREAPRHE